MARDRITPTLLLLILIGTIALQGCAPSAFGITWFGQRDWHQSSLQVIRIVDEKNGLTTAGLERCMGKPDARISGKAFLSGEKLVDDHRSDVLRIGRYAKLMHGEAWRESTIYIYDEKYRYPWPVAGGWRAYLFQAQGENVIRGWDTYPSWIPWQDDYWDDVRQRGTAD